MSWSSTSGRPVEPSIHIGISAAQRRSSTPRFAACARSRPGSQAGTDLKAVAAVLPGGADGHAENPGSRPVARPRLPFAAGPDEQPGDRPDRQSGNDHQEKILASALFVRPVSAGVDTPRRI